VSMGGMAFCIDMHEVSSSTRRGLIGLFSPMKKAAWHLNRIIAAVPEIVAFYNPKTAPALLDLQRFCTTLGLISCKKNLISLSDTAKDVVGYTLTNDQFLKASDCSKRPLSAAQIQYAVCDAQICVVVWEAIEQEESLRLSVLSSMTEPLAIPSKSTLQRYK
jgi:hypothetical protein